MRRVALGFAMALIMGVGTSSALAQSNDQAPAETAPATWNMAIVAGADGWADPSEPLPVRVTLSSDLLLVGRIDATVGGVTSSQAVEIPAGGVKDYVLKASAPGQRRQLRIELISNENGSETVLESEQLAIRVPADDLVVAVIDAAPYETVIRSATPTPAEQDIQLVRMTGSDVTNLNSAVSYLIVPAAAMSDLDPAALETVRRWVEDGGRLIGAATNVSRVADPAGGGSFISAGAVGVRLGDGEVTGINDFESVDSAGWSDLLRSVPQPGIVRIQQDGSGSASLVSAALSGRSASVPALPWLLLGILLFVVLVGPVNFIVLRGFGKPEWAWATVPLLSAVFVAGFWIVGRSQLQPFTITHSSVVVESARGIEGHTALVVQVESGGQHELRLPDGWSSEGQNFPGATPGVAGTDETGRAVVDYELEDLGVGTAQGAWTSTTPTDLDFTLQKTDTGFDLTVRNGTNATFVNWGVVVDGYGYLSRDNLAPGQEATVATRTSRIRNPRYQSVILEAIERRGFIGNEFYTTEYQQIFPMAAFAEQISRDLAENGVHFFGFTDDTTHNVEFDGSTAASTGRTLIVAEVPDNGSVLAARTTARPRLLGVDGASSVEQYYDEIYAYGAESVMFHYSVPAGVASGKISPGFTSLSVSEVYDWTKGAFVSFEWGDTINLSSAASPTGEIVVRASRDNQAQFFDESLNLSRFSLDWG